MPLVILAAKRPAHNISTGTLHLFRTNRPAAVVVHIHVKTLLVSPAMIRYARSLLCIQGIVTAGVEDADGLQSAAVGSYCTHK